MVEPIVACVTSGLSAPGVLAGSGKALCPSACVVSRAPTARDIMRGPAAERKAIVKRQMLGLGETPNRADVIRNIATNLSRFNEKRQATTTLEHAIAVQRGIVRGFLVGSDAVQRTAQRHGEGEISKFAMARLAEAVHQVQRHAMDIWSSTAEIGRPRAPQWQQERGYERER